MKKISFVLPVFNEQSGINEFHIQLLDALKNALYEFEFIYVNDGSTDESLLVLKQMALQYSGIKVLTLSRNFGHQAAVFAGLGKANGDAVIVMDTDLQDPPPVCLEFIQAWENGNDVVYGTRRSRQDSFIKKFFSKIFYRVLDSLSEVKIPVDAGDFRLLDRKVVNHVLGFGETALYLRGIYSYVGFQQISIPFDRHSRYADSSGYSIRKMVELAENGLLSFSTRPLKLILRIGIVSSLLSFLGIIYVVSVKLLYPAAAVSGWAFAASVTLFIGATNLLLLGMVGLYIGKIYQEVLARPRFIISND